MPPKGRRGNDASLASSPPFLDPSPHERAADVSPRRSLPPSSFLSPQVRTKTLVKNAVVQVDAAPFRAWYQQHYGKKIGIKVKNGEKVESEDIDAKRSNSLAKKLKSRNAKHEVAANIDTQFTTGRLYALVTSRPGQCGRCDGYILEGKELDFYVKKMQKKKGKHAAE